MLRRGSAVMLIAVLSVSAAMADPLQPSCQSMLTAIKTLDFLSTFTEAVQKAGLSKAFSGEGLSQKSVVFVPTDGAFDKAASDLGMKKSDLMNNTLTLRRLIQNHVIPGDVDDKSIFPQLYSTMDFGSYLTIYSKDDEMMVETENSTVVAKATQILYKLCDESKLYVVGKVLIPAELNKAAMFKSDPGLAAISSADDYTSPTFFRRMFPGFGSASAADAPRPAAFPRAMFPGMRAPGAGAGVRLPSMSAILPGGLPEFGAASGTADEDATAGFGTGLMTGLATGALSVPQAEGFPTLPSAAGTPAEPAAALPGFPAAGLPSAGMFGSSSGTTGSGSFPSFPGFPAFEGASFPGFPATGASGLAGMFGGSATMGAPAAATIPEAASSVATGDAAPAA